MDALVGVSGDHQLDGVGERGVAKSGENCTTGTQRVIETLRGWAARFVQVALPPADCGQGHAHLHGEGHLRQPGGCPLLFESFSCVNTGHFIGRTRPIWDSVHFIRVIGED